MLRSSVREFIASEFMAAAGVPTTRALSLTVTGGLVTRDMFYKCAPYALHLAPTFAFPTVAYSRLIRRGSTRRPHTTAFSVSSLRRI